MRLLGLWGKIIEKRASTETDPVGVEVFHQF